MQQHAILLLAHGTPDTLDQMAPYLQHVTNGRPMPQHVIEELQHRYAEIGLRDEPLPEGPPLTRWTLLQGKLLAEELQRPVYVAMRNWHPFIADVVAEMRADGVQHATVLCLAPQNSRTSTGLYRRAFETAVRDDDGKPAFTYDFIAGWAIEPQLIEAFADRLRPTLATAPAGTPVLFTAHSVPCRTILTSVIASDSGLRDVAKLPRPVPADGIQDYGTTVTPDPYPVECKQTAASVAAAVGLAEGDWHFAFQSQGVAGAPWIGPTVEDSLTALAQAVHKAVVIQPIGFLCDHVEILYDIDVNFRDFAAKLGMQVLRPASLNDSPALIRALANVLKAQG